MYFYLISFEKFLVEWFAIFLKSRFVEVSKTRLWGWRQRLLRSWKIKWGSVICVHDFAISNRKIKQIYRHYNQKSAKLRVHYYVNPKKYAYSTSFSITFYNDLFSFDVFKCRDTSKIVTFYRTTYMYINIYIYI